LAVGAAWKLRSDALTLKKVYIIDVNNLRRNGVGRLKNNYCLTNFPYWLGTHKQAHETNRNCFAQK
jgi:hypothetical protein